MAGATSDYQRGAMDIAEQQATFELVMGLTKWGSLVVATVLVMVVLWFCTATGFVGAAVMAAVVAVAGARVLRGR